MALTRHCAFRDQRPSWASLAPTQETKVKMEYVEINLENYTNLANSENLELKVLSFGIDINN